MPAGVVELAAMLSKRLVKTLVLFAAVPVFLGSFRRCPLWADTYGPVIKNKSLDIEKKVSKTGEGTWKDKVTGLGAGDKVYFKVIVKNTGEVDLDDIEVEDELPRYLNDPKKVGGDGDFDVDGDDIEVDLGDLDEDEEKEYIYRAKVREDLPDNGVFCSYNIASVYYNDHKEGSDDAEVCFETGEVLGEVSELPEAGSSPVGLAAAGTLFSIGLALRKKVSSLFS